MKKSLLLLGFTVLGSAVLMSCSQKEDVTPSPDSTDRTEVRFSSNIITPVVKSRALGGVWDTEDAIGVYMFDGEGNDIVDEKAEEEAEKLKEQKAEEAAAKAEEKAKEQAELDAKAAAVEAAHKEAETK